MGGKRTPLLFDSFRSNLAKQVASFCFTQLEGYNFRIINPLIRLLGVNLSWLACKLYNFPSYSGDVASSSNLKVFTAVKPKSLKGLCNDLRMCRIFACSVDFVNDI